MERYKKKVLLICKETFTWPMHYVAKILREKGCIISALYTMPHEALREDPDYKLFKKLNPDIHVFDMKNMALEYIKKANTKNINLDWEYIKKIENKYSHYKNIWRQTLSSQFLTRYYHFRDYYKPISYDKQLLYVQEYYKELEKIFFEFKPDVVYDADIEEFGRTAILEISKNFNIPYISIEDSYFKNYWIPTGNLTLQIDKWLEKEYSIQLKNIESGKDSMFKEAVREYEEFTGSSSILSTEYKKIHKNAYFNFPKDFLVSLKTTVRSIIRQTTRYFKYYRIVTTPIFAEPVQAIFIHSKIVFRKFALNYFRIFKRLELKKYRYILFPLHVIPESATFVKSPFYINQRFIIESLSKSVLTDQLIFVKEHPAMIGETPLNFYKEVSKLPNVFFINSMMYPDPKPYIENCDGVVTITGRSAFEAAMLGKPSITFGSCAFNLIKQIIKVENISDLPNIIRNWDKNSGVSNYETKKNIIAYINLILKIGEELKLSVLKLPPHKVDQRLARKEAEKLLKILTTGEECIA